MIVISAPGGVYNPIYDDDPAFSEGLIEDAWVI
ncbi:MAG: hypothetical protein ACI86X_001274 [Moritella sp.]|jgi:hypothetical protein